MKNLYLTALFFITAPWLFTDLGAKTQPLSISGYAKIEKPADELNLSIGVITESTKAYEALQNNNQIMQKVMEAVKSVGLTTANYQTGIFSIQPVYTPYLQNPPPDWKQSIIGYEVSNTINVKTDKLNLAGTLIDVATQAGATKIEDIRFQLKDPSLYRDEVISTAFKKARDDAISLAKAANLKLGKILKISLSYGQDEHPMPMYSKFAMVGDSSSVPLESGNVKINATVNVEYEIED